MPPSHAQEWWAKGSERVWGMNDNANEAKGGGGGGEEESKIRKSSSPEGRAWVPLLPPSPEGRRTDVAAAAKGGGERGELRDEETANLTADTPPASAVVADDGNELGLGFKEGRRGGGGRREGGIVQHCSVCGAESGESCRPGCPLERSRRPDPRMMAVSAAGGGRQPQILFNELWQDKSDRVRR